jgi:hypothetical protein
MAKRHRQGGGYCLVSTSCGAVGGTCNWRQVIGNGALVGGGSGVNRRRVIGGGGVAVVAGLVSTGCGVVGGDCCVGWLRGVGSGVLVSGVLVQRWL